MRTSNILKLTAATLLICGMMSTNAMAASTTGSASAQIVPNISITNTANLSFGGIVPDAAAAGTVTITPGGAVSNTVVALIAPLANRAEFAVSGDPGQTYTPTVDATVNLTGTGSDMLVTLTSAQANAGSALDGSGVDTIFVGGTLPVGIGQTTGTYSGTFNVTVNY